MKILLLVLSLSGLFLSGCATYNYANRVKMVAFDDDLSKGKSAGPIRGEDCTWRVLGYSLGGAPTLDRAFINAKNQAGAAESAGFADVAGKKGRGQALRYVNNVSTKNEGFDAVVVGKQCIVVTGIGHR